MRKRAVMGVLALACLVIVGAFLLLERGGNPPALALPHDDAPASETTRLARTDPAAQSRPETWPIRTVAYADIAGVAVDDGEPLRVLVVEEASGLPVPGTEVAWCDARDEDSEAMGHFAAPSRLLADFERAPHRAVADARGIAVVRISDRLMVAGRKGDQFGFRRFESPPRGEIRLPIVPGPLVAARVIRSSGEPAPGVRVWFSIDRRTGRSSGGTDRSVISRHPDGLAVAHHPGMSAEDFLGETVEVSAHLEGLPNGRVKVPWEELKHRPIVLTLPPTGRVVVRLTDPEGAPVSAPAEVSLAATRKDRPVRMGARTNNGIAEFCCVPLGTTVTATARTDAFDSVIDQPIGELVGDDLNMEVRFQRRKPVLVGRAIDEGGRPFARRVLDVEVVSSQGVPLLPATAQVETDARGLFRLSIDRNTPGASACDLEFEVFSAPLVVERSVFVSLPKLSEASEIQLGDIRLLPPAPVAVGVVVDDLGDPLGGALVVTDSVRGGPISGIVVIGRRSRSLYQRLRARTDSAGEFLIPFQPRARDHIQSFCLKAELDGYVCDGATAPLKPSYSSVKIVLQGAGIIEGRLLLPDAAPVRKLEIRVKEQRFEDCVDSDGRFQIAGVLPGRVPVAIYMAGVVEPLATIGEVTVPRLGITNDARLRSIDLRSHGGAAEAMKNRPSPSIVR